MVIFSIHPMKILDIKPKRQKRVSAKPVLFSAFGQDIMINPNQPLHPAAETVRQEIFSRFLHENSLAVSFDQAAMLISQKLHDDFASWPSTLIEQVIKKIHFTSKSVLDDKGLFGWLLQELRNEVKLKDDQSFDDIVFNATVDRIRGHTNGYHPAILAVVDKLPERHFNIARASIERSTTCQDSQNLPSSNSSK